MASYINGKPMKEWIKEQQEKNGVLVIHRAMTSDGWNHSTYNETTVTLGSDRDVCYENADITLKLHGKEYRMQGRKVEFKGRRWYVDGKLQDIPTDAADTMKKANDDVQSDLTDQLNRMYGTVNLDSVVGSTYIHHNGSTTVRTRTTGGSRSDRRVVMKNGGTVNVHRGGKTFTIKGDYIENRNGQWYADGEAVDWDDLGGKYEETDVVRIEIHGDVESLNVKSSDVTVNGSCGNISTASGDVRCDLVNGNVHTMSGDVHADVISGSASTMSGDIFKG